MFPIALQLAGGNAFPSARRVDEFIAVSYTHLATLLMAMGEVKGKAFADQHGLAAYFVWRSETGFAVYATPAFTQLLLD